MGVISKIYRKISSLIFSSEKQSFLSKIYIDTESLKTVFDIGTYHGKLVDDIILEHPNAQTHCFEPYKVSFDFLSLRYEGKTNVVLNNVAVSDKSGSASFNINKFEETNSLLESVSINEEIDSLTKTTSAQEVVLVTIDDYCLKNNIDNIDLVKIDTQGNSYNVLLGMEKLLKAKKIKYLYVEAEFIEIYKNEKLFSEIELLMRSYEYSIVNLYNLNYINNNKLAWCDVLFSVKSEL